MSGIAQLVVRQRSEQNYVLAAMLVCIAWVQIRVGLLFTGQMENIPGLFLINYSSIYIIGPLLYYYYKAFLNSQWKSYRSIWPHFLIPAILIILEMIMIPLIPSGTRSYIIHSLFQYRSDPFLVYIHIGFAAAGLSVISYQAFVLKDLVGLYGFRELKGIQLSFFIIIALGMICPIFFMIGLITQSMEYLRIGIFTFCLLELFTYFTAHRQPEFLNIIKKEIHKKRYERTQLHDLDADVINARLLELMEEDKMYEDENISLGYLSEQLKITPHQLSEFLNRYRNVSFYTFVTTYRIEEARKLLSEDTDLTILQIAYNVGFNSKSAFNSAFKKFTGTTPQSFRNSKKQTKNNGSDL